MKAADYRTLSTALGWMDDPSRHPVGDLEPSARDGYRRARRDFTEFVGGACSSMESLRLRIEATRAVARSFKAPADNEVGIGALVFCARLSSLIDGRVLP